MGGLSQGGPVPKQTAPQISATLRLLGRSPPCDASHFISGQALPQLPQWAGGGGEGGGRESCTYRSSHAATPSSKEWKAQAHTHPDPEGKENWTCVTPCHVLETQRAGKGHPSHPLFSLD